MSKLNTRIALSSLSILAALSLMGGAAFAFFSDTGTSSSNTFSTGTLDLKLSDSGEADQESVTASFGGTLAPGGCTGVQTLTLKNTGSIAANHAEVKLTSNVVTDAGGNASPDIDSFLRINQLDYDAGNVLSQIPDANTNGFVDLNDWAAATTKLDNLALTNLNVGHNLDMDVCLDGSAGNTLQGDSVVTTFTVNLNQDASQ